MEADSGTGGGTEAGGTGVEGAVAGGASAELSKGAVASVGFEVGNDAGTWS